MGGGLIDGANGYDGRARMAKAAVQSGDDDLLLAEVPELGSEDVVDDFGAVEGAIVDLLASDACAELESGGQLRSFGEAEAVFFGEFAYRQTPERSD